MPRKKKTAPPLAKTTKTKAAFILSFEPETPAKQIIEEGKTAGYDVSAQYIYSVRSEAKVRSGVRKADTQRAALAEAELRRLAAAMGPKKAIRVIAEFERKHVKLIASG